MDKELAVKKAPIQDNDENVPSDDEHVQGSAPANLRKVEEGLTSKRFEGLLITFEVVAFLILVLSSWFDSCPCHSPRIGIDNAASRSRRKNYWHRVGLNKCLMCGRRAPSFASGEVMEYIREIFKLAKQL